MAIRERLADVARWLGRHGIGAEQVALPTIGDDGDALWRWHRISAPT